jgi:predicted component of type VI protein secretion system
MASRFHCVIEKVPDGYLIRDLGASNPTRVNGRVVKSALLAPGDEILVGSTKLVLVTPGEAGADGSAAAPSSQDTIAAKAKAARKAIAAPEALDELEEVEELTEMDVVEEELIEDPLSMDGADVPVLDDSDYEHSLRPPRRGAGGQAVRRDRHRAAQPARPGRPRGGAVGGGGRPSRWSTCFACCCWSASATT